MTGSHQPVLDYPAYGVAPQPYAPQPYAPPQFGTPHYAPVYGVPAIVDYRPRRRPGIVTAAAVLGFVVGGFYLIADAILILLLVVAAGSSHVAASPLVFVLIVIVVLALVISLAMSGLFVWGGIAAVRGRSRIPLVAASAIQLSFTLLGMVLALATQGTAAGGYQLVRIAVNLAFVLLILIFIFQPSSSDFFRARRGSRS
jgi:hypothetical protein